MSGDTAWAIDQLEEFMVQCREHAENWGKSEETAPETLALYDEIIARLPVISAIADTLWPQWRDQVPEHASYTSRYHRLFHVAQHLVVLLQQQEIDRRRAGTGPGLTLASLHPEIAGAAQDPWQDGRFGGAVAAAEVRLGKVLQIKVGRPDLPAAELLAQSFSPAPPEPGAPRLRLTADGDDRQTDLHEGVRALGRACFQAIPAVLAERYGPDAEPPEDEALHCLATFSLLARWIDAARVVAEGASPDAPVRSMMDPA